MSRILSETYIIAKYGNAGDETNLVSITLPYPMRIAWDTKTTIKTMRCHKLIAADLLKVFNELLTTYGLAKIQELGIDLFGGCFNFRKMRGGSSYSRHSWGIAVDLSPDANSLKVPYAKSQFAKPEYAKLHEIFYKYGFINYGKEKGFDTMHFEIFK